MALSQTKKYRTLQSVNIGITAYNQPDSTCDHSLYRFWNAGGRASTILAASIFDVAVTGIPHKLRAAYTAVPAKLSARQIT